MSYTFLLEQGEESSAECFSDIPAYVLSRLNLTAKKSFYKDKETEFCQSSQSGTMCEHLMASHGEEKLTSSVEDSPAKTYLAQEKELASRVNGQDSGERWRGWLAKYDQDLSLWKTPQCSLLGDYIEFSGTWPKWGMMLDGVCWELTTSVRRTKENGFGYWPTPDANMGKRGTQEKWIPIRPSGQPAQYPINQFLRDKYHKRGKPSPELMEWLMGWPISWTDLKPLEMGKFQRWRQAHSAFCHNTKKGELK